MGRYVKESCPNCRTVISGWHRDPGNLKIGNPLFKCPKCGMTLIQHNFAEYIMFNGWLYFRYFIWQISGDLVISFLIGGILASIISHDDNIFMTLFWGISVLLFSLMFLRIIHIFKDEKRKSLERTNDVKYLKELYQANLISESKYNELSKRNIEK